jgi:hypothetical protein
MRCDQQRIGGILEMVSVASTGNQELVKPELGPDSVDAVLQSPGCLSRSQASLWARLNLTNLVR